MKPLKKFGMLLAAAALSVAATAGAAFAVEYNSVGFTAGNAPSIQKNLEMRTDANVPSATFNYGIIAGEGVDPTTAKPVPVYAGVFNDGKTKPSISNISFSATDTGTVTTTTGDNPKKIANKKQAIDFTGITFDKPGIYRYVITESGTNQGVTNDTNKIYLDVYVENAGTQTDDKENLQIKGTVAYYGVNPPEATTSPATTKSDTFVNTYATYNASVTKAVTGNQGDKTKPFTFTVNISGAVAGTVYAVVAPSGSGPATLTATGGKIENQTYTLKHGETLTIKGLAEGTVVDISENPENYVLDNLTATGSLVANQTDKKAATATTGIAADSAATFTNKLQGDIPTGVLLTVAPGIAIVILAAAGIFFITRRKKQQA